MPSPPYREASDFSIFLILTCSRIGRGGRFGRKGVAINMVTGLGDNFCNTSNEELPLSVADCLTPSTGDKRDQSAGDNALYGLVSSKVNL